ncbi:retrotransposon protein, putative, ty1-copia subclass [Tanacetum coccineum]
MHNIGKTIGEQHALLIEDEKGLPKKAATPQVMEIQGGRIQKANKKSLNAKGKGKGKGKGKDKSYIPKPKNPKPYAKEHPTKDDACHNYKENDVLYFNAIPCNGIYETDMLNLVPNVNSIYDVSDKRVKHNLDSTYLWHCSLAHISKKQIEKLQHDGLLKSTNEESFDKCVSCLSSKMRRKPFSHRTERANDLLGRIHTDVCDRSMNESYNSCAVNPLIAPRVHAVLNIVPPHRSFDKTTYKYIDPKKRWLLFLLSHLKTKSVCARYVEFLEKNLISQEVSGRAVELEEIQDEDASPSENTSEIPMEVEGFKPPQEEVVPVRRSARTHRASDRLCLNVDVEEYNLGDLNESTNYKAALLDPESNKWVDAMNAEMQSMKVYQVWCLADLPHNSEKLANGLILQTKIDYEETFSPVADIRAIRILIAIAAFYDYEIWQTDVKTVFLNGYLNKDIYMVQTEGFIDPKHPRKASGSNVTFFILYVDDIIIMGNHILSLQSVRSYLEKCFAMKDLGEAAFILGIKIYRDRSKRLIRLSQSAYMYKILKRFRMDNSKHGNIPMQQRFDLNETQGASTTGEVAKRRNGTLLLRREPHWTAVKTILKYLRNTKDVFLVYSGIPEAELRVDCYCDAGFETDRDDIKSQS